MTAEASTEDAALFEQCFDLVFAELTGNDLPRDRFLAACVHSRDGNSRLARKALYPLFATHDATWERYRSQRPQDAGDDDEESDVPTYSMREMVELFEQRVTAMYYAKRRQRLFLEAADVAPYWALVAIDDGRTPEECVRLAGVVRRFDDPYWEAYPVPCESVFCRCRMRALTEIEVSKLDGTNEPA